MRYEEYLIEEFRDPGASSGITRREFLAATGGILILFHLGDLEAAPGRPGGGREETDWNAFLRIGEDGSITLFSGKVELGQGIHVALAQVVAEELDVPVERVETIQADTDRCPFDAGTFGSRSIRFHAPLLRMAAAEARGVLVQIAAEQWQLPTEKLAVKEGKVFVAAEPTRALTFAALARGQRIERHLDPRPEPEPMGRYTVVGTSVPRRDAVAKVTGAAQYAGDIRLPGLLYGHALRPANHHFRLVKADTTEARKLPGVRVVEEGDFVAVLAEHPDAAEAALATVKAEWEPHPERHPPFADVDDKSIYDHLVRTAGDARTAAEGGDLEQGAKESVQVFEETYYNAYVAHAPIEPHTATVNIEGDRVTVWPSTQRPFGCKDEVARELGVPARNVHVITPYVGGGFGGKSRNQQAIEAARLAKATGLPVQVAWTREEETFYDTFRPAAVIRIRSGVNGEGKIVLWDYVVYNAGERGAPQFYDIAHHRTRTASGRSPLATGPWRAPANNSNTFAREQQIDLMAMKAGVDPVTFRLRNLAPDAPARRVLEAAAKQFGYRPATAPSRRGIGVAVGTDSDTWVAHIARVQVDRRTGKVKVERVVCAQDMGLCINPEGAKTQMEGCIAMGLGYALYEGIRFRSGEVLNRNFHNYPIARFSDLPRIETVIVDPTPEDGRAHGGGEPAIICMGAVIANAIHDATGVRRCHLPITPG
ncbi:MAG: xanthine dehydrogenase family protein molybdopterin-binding subunit [Armatimonadetes bacterium]|nr:xanthine dehydrogenase family protein molybdopterin-binding subunit [Armatimonadota bacterium]